MATATSARPPTASRCACLSRPRWGSGSAWAAPPSASACRRTAATRREAGHRCVFGDDELGVAVAVAVAVAPGGWRTRSPASWSWRARAAGSRTRGEPSRSHVDGGGQECECLDDVLARVADALRGGVVAAAVAAAGGTRQTLVAGRRVVSGRLHSARVPAVSAGPGSSLRRRAATRANAERVRSAARDCPRGVSATRRACVPSTPRRSRSLNASPTALASPASGSSGRTFAPLSASVEATRSQSASTGASHAIVATPLSVGVT